MANVIEEITRIEVAVLQQRATRPRSVAQKMSWAAGRKTTREEDRAYSLLGIFGVNIPTLYGEKSKAFIRLQEEIIRTTFDHSIFAWKCESQPQTLLATSPDHFVDAGDLRIMQYKPFRSRFRISSPLPEYARTNYGLRIQLPLEPMESTPGVFRAYLATYSPNIFWPLYETLQVYIYLRAHPDVGPQTYARVCLDRESIGVESIRNVDITRIACEKIYILDQNSPPLQVVEIRVAVQGREPLQNDDPHVVHTLDLEGRVLWRSDHNGYRIHKDGYKFVRFAVHTYIGHKIERAVIPFLVFGFYRDQVWFDICVVRGSTMEHDEVFDLYRDPRRPPGDIRHKPASQIVRSLENHTGEEWIEHSLIPKDEDPISMLENLKMPATLTERNYRSSGGSSRYDLNVNFIR